MKSCYEAVCEFHGEGNYNCKKSKLQLADVNYPGRILKCESEVKR